MADVMVSYKRSDQARVVKIVRALEAHGLSVWWDRSIEHNADFGDVIQKEIDAARAVVVCWSEWAGLSQWVRGEATLAQHQNKYVGTMITECMPPVPFNQLNNANLIDWNGAADHPAFLMLLRTVGQLVKRDDIASLAASQERHQAEVAAREQAEAEAKRAKEIAEKQRIADAAQKEIDRVENLRRQRPLLIELFRAPFVSPRTFLVGAAIGLPLIVASAMNPLFALDPQKYGNFLIGPLVAAVVLSYLIGFGIHNFRSRAHWIRKTILTVPFLFAVASFVALYAAVPTIWKTSADGAAMEREIREVSLTERIIGRRVSSVPIASISLSFKRATWTAFSDGNEFQCSRAPNRQPIDQCKAVEAKTAGGIGNPASKSSPENSKPAKPAESDPTPERRNFLEASNTLSSNAHGPDLAADRPASIDAQADDDAWADAVLKNSGSAFENYLNAFPTGSHVAAARTRLAELSPPAPGGPVDNIFSNCGTKCPKTWTIAEFGANLRSSRIEPYEINAGAEARAVGTDFYPISCQPDGIYHRRPITSSRDSSKVEIQTYFLSIKNIATIPSERYRKDRYFYVQYSDALIDQEKLRPFFVSDPYANVPPVIYCDRNQRPGNWGP